MLRVIGILMESVIVPCEIAAVRASDVPGVSIAQRYPRSLGLSISPSEMLLVYLVSRCWDPTPNSFSTTCRLTSLVSITMLVPSLANV